MHDDHQQSAFDRLYNEHAGPVYRFALRLCGNREDAEDLAAEALAQAYQKFVGYRGDASARTWLCAIVLNQWRMHKRKRKVQEDRLESNLEFASTFTFNDNDLAEAIATLPDPLREAFLLVKGEGFTHTEAAKVARVPIGTMYFRVHTAIRHLRERLGSERQLERPPVEVRVSHEM
jgi:RNA polymerase sigma-70 factor (ECF subfamily)